MEGLIRKRIKIIVCMAVMIAGIWQASGQLGFFRECAGFRYYELRERVSVETAAAMRAEEAEQIPDMVLWDFLDGQTVSIHSPAERTGEISVVTVCGEPECLTGNFTVPHCGDTRGCLLDRGTAWKLFGTGEAEGETVTCQGKEYRIKGILDGVEPTMLIQADADYEEGFGRMTVADSCGLGDWELENRLRNRYGVSLIKTDWGMVRTAVKLAFCMMVFSVCVSVWRELCRCRKCQKEYQRKLKGQAETCRKRPERQAEAYQKRLADKVVSVMGVAVGIALFSGLLWLTGIRGIPAEYIPPQWSDFEFYREAWESLGSAWKNLLRLNISTFELKMVQNSAILCLDILLAGAAARYLTAALCDRITGRTEAKTLHEPYTSLSLAGSAGAYLHRLLTIRR